MGLLLCVSGLSALPMSPVTRDSTPELDGVVVRV